MSPVRRGRPKRAFILLSCKTESNSRHISPIFNALVQCPPTSCEASFSQCDGDRHRKVLATHYVLAIFSLDKHFDVAITSYESGSAMLLIDLRFHVRICRSRLAVISHQQYLGTGCDLQQPTRLLTNRAERHAAKLGLVPDIVYRRFIKSRGGAFNMLRWRATGNGERRQQERYFVSHATLPGAIVTINRAFRPVVRSRSRNAQGPAHKCA